MNILALIAIAIGALICVANWYALFETVSARRHTSAVPVLGALLLFLGLLGVPATEAWAWLALPADWGTLSMLIAIPWLWRQGRETSRRNLLHSFVSVKGSRRCEVRLFRSGRFTLVVRYDPTLPCSGSGHGHILRSFTGAWREDPRGYLLQGYEGERRLIVHTERAPPRTEELNYTGDRCCSWDSLDAIVLTRDAGGNGKV